LRTCFTGLYPIVNKYTIDKPVFICIAYVHIMMSAVVKLGVKCLPHVKSGQTRYKSDVSCICL